MRLIKRVETDFSKKSPPKMAIHTERLCWQPLFGGGDLRFLAVSHRILLRLSQTLSWWKGQRKWVNSWKFQKNRNRKRQCKSSLETNKNQKLGGFLCFHHFERSHWLTASDRVDLVLRWSRNFDRYLPNFGQNVSSFISMKRAEKEG